MLGFSVHIAVYISLETGSRSSLVFNVNVLITGLDRMVQLIEPASQRFNPLTQTI